MPTAPTTSPADRALTVAPTAPARVVVLGGGYAGVVAANRIAGRLGRRADVALVSDRDELVHRIRLHEVVAGRRVRRYPLRRLVRRRVERIVAGVICVDAGARLVVVRHEGALRALRYDYLVWALGSRIALTAPGAAAHAGGLAGLDAALAARARLAALPDGAPVVVVGGGLTAVEAAAEIAEARPTLAVTLLATAIAPGLSDAARAYVGEVLADLGVAVREATRVAAVEPDAVIAADGERVPAALALWAAGFTGRAAVDSDLPLDRAGRVVVDATLAVPGAPGVWAAGDGAAPPPGLDFVRMACATAIPTGAHAADNVVRAIRGAPPAPFRFGFVGQCVSLGRRRGVVQRVDAHDAPTGPVYTGRTAALIKEAVCRFVIGSLRLERRWAGAYRWPQTVPARAAPQLPAGSPERATAP